MAPLLIILSTVACHWATFFWTDVTRLREWHTEQRCCKRVCPAAVEPPVVPPVTVWAGELEPQAASNAPSITSKSRMLIIETIRIFIY